MTVLRGSDGPRDRNVKPAAICDTEEFLAASPTSGGPESDRSEDVSNAEVTVRPPWPNLASRSRTPNFEGTRQNTKSHNYDVRV